MSDGANRPVGPWLVLVTTGLVLWLGFVLHTSQGDHLVLGRYSPSYAGLVGAIGVVWLWSAWWGWRNRATLGATLRGIFGTLLVTLVMAAIALPLAYIWLHQRSLEQTVLAPIDAKAHAFFQIEEIAQLPEHEPGALRILTLGGSTTYGPELTREQTYPARLEAHLETRFGDRPVQVLNAGVPWHTSMHSLLRYIAVFSAWEPDVVIVLHAFNDIFQSSEGRLTSGAFRSDYGHFFGALGKRANPRDNFPGLIRGALTGNWLAQTWYSDLRDSKTAPREALPEVDLLRPLPTFEANLRQIIRRTANDGARLILLTQPFLYREDMPANERDALFYDFYYEDYARVPGIAEQQHAMEVFNDATRGIATETGTTVIDLAARLPRSADMMYDDVHYTVAGADRIATLIAEHPVWE